MMNGDGIKRWGDDVVRGGKDDVGQLLFGDGAGDSRYMFST